jgi:hypothetical protein
MHRCLREHALKPVDKRLTSEQIEHTAVLIYGQYYAHQKTWQSNERVRCVSRGRRRVCVCVCVCVCVRVRVRVRVSCECECYLSCLHQRRVLEYITGCRTRLWVRVKHLLDELVDVRAVPLEMRRSSVTKSMPQLAVHRQRLTAALCWWDVQVRVCKRG